MEKNLSICGVDLCLKVVFLVSKPYLCGRWKKKQKGAGKKKKTKKQKGEGVCIWLGAQNKCLLEVSS